MSAGEHSTDTAHLQQEPAAAVVVIGMSAGGLLPLRRLVRDLPFTFGAAIVVAQHVQGTTCLPEILRADTTLPVSLAHDGALIRPGSIHISPAQQHVVVNPDATIALSDRGRIHFFRPNADWLFESAAASFRERTIAVVLSGMQNDGARGVRCIHAAGGMVIVQDPHTCERPEMPRAAIATGSANHILPPHAIGPMLHSVVSAIDLSNRRRTWEAPFADRGQAVTTAAD
jgi:two-component system chemotaxis response regulator CheB